MRQKIRALCKAASIASLGPLLLALPLVASAAQFGAPPPEPAPLPSGKAAPQFSTRTLDNHALSLKELRGKVVVLDFWATWCVSCKQQMPALDKLQRDYAGKGVRVIGISLDNSQIKLVQPTVQALKIGYTISADPTRNIPIGIRYNADVLPCIYVIDRHGILRWDHSGVFEGEDAKLRGLLDKLIAEK